ncbi:MFS transporter [Streptomyces neyagawaensis]|uniref:MFS transporter n=1 Tax=Streptomyces neyagawaensis TaxID=42238 RepID=UPI00099E3E5A|nr:MFS transporter [Streptomyces neyagawaensis]MCL6739434.1 MFS transporter [Streptomyces neyagawaensis]MDE1688344.1 MFS transporter [Streptomyces neyagawaensis]MDG5808508.1 MFS transporter [Streptomyces ossamyceticus]
MDAAAFAMTTYGIPLLVLATTHSATLTGLAFALEWAPRLMAFAAAGALVDRHGTTRVFRLAATARATLVLAAALLLQAQTDGPGETITVMMLAAGSGVLTEFSYIAAETAGGLASRTDGTPAHRVQSVLLGIDQTATLAGPALAGLLLNHTGATGMLAAAAAFSLLAAALAPPRIARRHTDQLTTSPTTAHQGLRTGWQTLRSLPTLGWLVAGLTLSNLAIGFLQAAVPVIVVQEFGQSSAGVGLLWSAAAAASLIAVALCRRAIDRYGMWPVGAVSAAIAASAFLALSLAHTYAAYLALIAVVMAGESGMTVVLRTLRSPLIPADVFGSTLALTILLLLLPFPIAGLLVAVVPSGQLGHAISVCAVLQAVGLATAFTRLRTLPGLHPSAL